MPSPCSRDCSVEVLVAKKYIKRALMRRSIHLSAIPMSGLKLLILSMLNASSAKCPLVTKTAYKLGSNVVLLVTYDVKLLWRVQYWSKVYDWVFCFILRPQCLCFYLKKSLDILLRGLNYKKLQSRQSFTGQAIKCFALIVNAPDLDHIC